MGVGYVFRTRRVFFTLNGKEVYQMGLPDGMLDIKLLYPTFSLGGLKDRIQVNFGMGKTSFRFDLQSKIKVSSENGNYLLVSLLSSPLLTRLLYSIDVLQEHIRGYRGV